MMGYLKETILVDDDRPVVEGEYYVSRYNRTDLLLKHLKKFMTGEGDGVVDALWKVGIWCSSDRIGAWLTLKAAKHRSQQHLPRRRAHR